MSIPAPFPAYHFSCRIEHGSGADVKGNMEERAVKLAQYIIENGATVRSAADQFGVSKSTVHMEVMI